MAGGHRRLLLEQPLREQHQHQPGAGLRAVGPHGRLPAQPQHGHPAERPERDGHDLLRPGPPVADHPRRRADLHPQRELHLLARAPARARTIHTEGRRVLLRIEKVLSDEQLAHARHVLERASWIDGRVTAGHQSGLVKENRQIKEGTPEARELGDLVLAALERSALFISAALPLRVFPPLFNCYEPGMHFGAHVDNAIRQIPGTPFRVRTDLSATLFLSRAEDYDGGELVVETANGGQSVKLPAGDMILYPATSLHRVNPVTRGTRFGSFFWIQSMVREESQRALLFDLDMAINKVNQAVPNHPGVVALTCCYHNLLRTWADA